MAIMKTSVRCKIEPQHPEPQEPKSPPVPLESLDDIAWELWLLIELLAPVRRRLPNTAFADLGAIRRCRGDHNRLGHALMLCYLRYPGRPLKAGERPPRP